MGILILIPALNEAVTIEEVVIASRKTGYDVLVVDDGSSDATSTLAADAGAIVVRHPCNLGVVAALQTGYIYSLEHGYDIVIQLDGDGQHDPADIGTMLAPLLNKSADFVIGSRFLGVGTYEMPFARRMGRSMITDNPMLARRWIRYFALHKARGTESYKEPYGGEGFEPLVLNFSQGAWHVITHGGSP